MQTSKQTIRPPQKAGVPTTSSFTACRKARCAFKVILGALFASLCLLTNIACAALNLNGVALHSELGKDQFIAGLYVEDLSSDAKDILLSDQRKRMEIKVLANRLLSRKFQRQWIEGVAINAGNNDLKKHAQNLADFSNMLKIKLIKNDTLTIERTFRRGVLIGINGVHLGNIQDTSFFDLLLRTWIGPVPLSSSFKEVLLQAGSIDPNLLTRFESVRTTNERVNNLTLALASKQADKALATAAQPITPPIVTQTQPSTATSTATATNTTSSLDSTQETETLAQAVTPTDTLTAEDEDESMQTDLLPEDENLIPEGALLAQSALLPENTPVFDDESLTNENPFLSDTATESTTLNENQIINDDIFDDEEEDDFSYTAADLLSRQLYISKLTRWTGKKIRYPSSALRKGQQGTTRVTVTIDREGKVINQEITDSSNIKSLDKAAKKAIKSASPYPAVPEVLSGESFVFTVPIVFALRSPSS